MGDGLGPNPTQQQQQWATKRCAYLVAHFGFRGQAPAPPALRHPMAACSRQSGKFHYVPSPYD